MHARPIHAGRLLLWGAYALLLLVAPLIFNQGASLSILSQTGTTVILALSFNLLLGQGGMLSLGHTVYSGLGAYVAIHALNLAGKGMLPIPVALIPLVGGLAGAMFGVVFGALISRKSGITFSMITLGIVELVFAATLMWPEFFGGEAGISANRVVGGPFLGISYGPQIQVYYLIAFWLFISTAAMFAFTRTPLGRMLNAVRDNPERAEFVGYDTHCVRFLALIISAFFAGIAGGLAAINFELVTPENVSVLRSASVLLATFIGGLGFFFGPIIGAVIGVFMTVVLSEFTKAWQLYFGALFIVMVMVAPGGVAGLLMLSLRLLRYGRLARVARPFGMVLGPGMLALAGGAMMIEMAYHRTLEAAAGSAMRLFGVALDTASVLPWLGAIALLAIGAIGAASATPAFRRSWDQANREIEEWQRGTQA